jgi:hypothetical protein
MWFFVRYKVWAKLASIPDSDGASYEVSKMVHLYKPVDSKLIEAITDELNKQGKKRPTYMDYSVIDIINITLIKD